MVAKGGALTLSAPPAHASLCFLHMREAPDECKVPAVFAVLGDENMLTMRGCMRLARSTLFLQYMFLAFRLCS